MSDWKPSDPDRRRNIQDHTDPIIICKQERRIHDMSDGIIRIEGKIEKLDLRINGTLDKISSFMDSGKGYRIAIVSVAFTLLIHVLVSIYVVGQNFRQVEINTERLAVIEEEHRQGVQ